MGIDCIVAGQDPETFKQRFVSKCPLKPAAGILDQCIQKDQCSNLTMYVAILSIVA